MMNKACLLLIGCIFQLLALPVKADFGDSDFSFKQLQSGPQSYHDAWCGRIKNKCRIRFQGMGMWVEGQGGIQLHQFNSFRLRDDSIYVRYVSDKGDSKESLFIFANFNAQMEFVTALNRWRKQNANLSQTLDIRKPRTTGNTRP